MKIVVHNHFEQYALSRKQVEAIAAILPKEYFLPIKEFHLSHSLQGAEIFEYHQSQKIVYFTFPVAQKNNELLKQASVELLLGLARIKSSTKWGIALPKNERIEHEPFVNLWLGKCLEVLQSI